MSNSLQDPQEQPMPCLRVERRLLNDGVPSRTDEPDEQANGINKKLIRSRTMIWDARDRRQICTTCTEHPISTTRTHGITLGCVVAMMMAASRRVGCNLRHFECNLYNKWPLGTVPYKAVSRALVGKCKYYNLLVSKFKPWGVCRTLAARSVMRFICYSQVGCHVCLDRADNLVFCSFRRPAPDDQRSAKKTDASLAIDLSDGKNKHDLRRALGANKEVIIMSKNGHLMRVQSIYWRSLNADMHAVTDFVAPWWNNLLPIEISNGFQNRFQLTTNSAGSDSRNMIKSYPSRLSLLNSNFHLYAHPTGQPGCRQYQTDWSSRKCCYFFTRVRPMNSQFMYKIYNNQWTTTHTNTHTLSRGVSQFSSRRSDQDKVIR